MYYFKNLPKFFIKNIICKILNNKYNFYFIFSIFFLLIIIVNVDVIIIIIIIIITKISIN